MASRRSLISWNLLVEREASGCIRIGRCAQLGWFDKGLWSVRLTAAVLAVRPACWYAPLHDGLDGGVGEDVLIQLLLAGLGDGGRRPIHIRAQGCYVIRP